MFDPKHILVPIAIDPEGEIDTAKHEVLVACDLALKFQAKITILYLAPLLQSGDGSAIDVTGQVYQVLEQTIQTRIDKGRAKLKELQELALKRNIQCDGRIVDSFDGTASAIIHVADEIQADLLIVSSEGRHGLFHMLFGSLGEEIATIAKIPVLLIHPENLLKSRNI